MSEGRPTPDEVFADLEEEHDQLDSLLRAVPYEYWDHASLCPGWSISDVVLHLALTEEAVAATIEGREAPIPVENASTVDEVMEAWVASQRGIEPSAVHARWNAARRGAVSALRGAAPDKRVAWAAAPLRPPVLAITRIAEHWAHALDVSEPTGLEYPDSDRLRHIVWLAHRTVPYAFQRADRGDAPTVRVELTSPSGGSWIFGPEDAECMITGPAGEFCRVAARRKRATEATGLSAQGDRGAEVLELLRSYA